MFRTIHTIRTIRMITSNRKIIKKFKTEAKNEQAEGKLSEIFIPHLIV